MKVKDLIENLKKYSEKYPDFDNWEVYTEQCELKAPDNNVSFETWFANYDKELEIVWDELDSSWVLRTPDRVFYFQSKEDAEKHRAEYKEYLKSEYEDLLKSKNKIEYLENMGWNFKYNSEGFVFRETNPYGFISIFERDKIVAIQTNY